MKRNKTIIFWLAVIGLLLGIWVLGDFVHAQIIQRAFQRFDAGIERDAAGVQIDAQAYSLPGSDTALLLVHGFNDTPRTFERLAPGLHAAGFSIRAVRLPGFGVPVEQMHSCTCQDWVQTVLDESRTLRESHSHIVVVGHSLGGAVALGAIIQQPEQFDAAVLLAPAIDVANHRSPLLPTRFWRRLGDLFLYFSKVYLSPYDRNDCRDPQYRNPPYKSPFSTRNIVQQTFRLMDRIQPQAESLQLPLLMVLSREDRVTDWVAAERFYDRLGSRCKKLRFYDTSGHALTVDRDYQTITADIIEFVQSLQSLQSQKTGQKHES